MSDSAAPWTVARHTPWDFPGKSVIYEDSNSLFSFPALCSSLSCCATSPRSRPPANTPCTHYPAAGKPSAGPTGRRALTSSPAPGLTLGCRVSLGTALPAQFPGVGAQCISALPARTRPQLSLGLQQERVVGHTGVV